MTSKEKLQNEVYTPMSELRNRFYAAETPEIWEQCKDELLELLTKAETMMDKEWYEKWKQSQFDSITKMHNFKVKYWEKQKQGKPQFTPKKTFLLQDDLSAALTKYIRLKTIELYLQMEDKYGSLESIKSISDEKNYL